MLFFVSEGMVNGEKRGQISAVKMIKRLNEKIETKIQFVIEEWILAKTSKERQTNTHTHTPPPLHSTHTVTRREAGTSMCACVHEGRARVGGWAGVETGAANCRRGRGRKHRKSRTHSCPGGEVMGGGRKRWKRRWMWERRKEGKERKWKEEVEEAEGRERGREISKGR